MPEQRFTRDIAKPAAEVWAAITAQHQPWYFGSIFAADLEPGGQFRYQSPDGRVEYIIGRLETVEPCRRMVQQFQFTDLSDDATRVSWLLSEVDGGTQVTLVHEFPAETSTYRRTRRGWPHLLRCLERVLITGRLPMSARLRNAVMVPFARVANRIR